MATEFQIDIVADPRPAEATFKRVDRGLDKIAREALELRNSLRQALSTRDAGISLSLNKLNTDLRESKQLARGAKNELESLGEGIEDPFAQQLASIRAQTEEIRLRNTAEGAIGQTLQIEANLRKQNRVLTAAETKELLATVSRQKQLNESIRQRAAVQKSLQSVQSRTRDLEIQALKISGARKDALREANRLRSEGVRLTASQVKNLEREFTKQRRLTREIEKASDEQARLNNRTNRFGNLARSAFAGIGIALVIRQLVRLSDEFLVIQNRLRTIIPDQKELNSTFDELVRIANLTRTELGGVVQLFQRGSLAADDLGASQQELLLFTERVGKALAVQGASAASSSGALLQLSQALGAGIVRAEEFNSIVEGAFPIAQAAARGIDGFAGSVTKLRGAIIKGQITSKEFFRGFLKGSEETAEQFERTTSTIGQAFTVLGNNATVLVGKLSESTGASTALANGIRLIADNLPQATFAASGLAVVLGTKYVVGAFAATGGTTALNTALLITIGRLAALTAAVAAAVAAFVVISNKISQFNQRMEELGETLRMVEGDAKLLSGTAAQLTSAQRELNAINGLVTRGIVLENGEIVRQIKLSDAQIARKVLLEGRIRLLGLALFVETRAQLRANEVAKAAIKVLEEQAIATKRQKALLTALQAPAKEFAQRQADLNALLKQGKIDQDAFNEALAKARPKKADTPEDPFAKQLASIQKRNRELQATAGLEGILLKFARTNNALKEQGRELGFIETARLIGAISLEDALLASRKKQQALSKLNEGLQVREAELQIRASIADGARRDALLIANRLKSQGIELDEIEIDGLTMKIDRQRELNAAIAQQARVENLAAQLDVTAQLAQAENDLLEVRRQFPGLADEVDQALQDMTLRQLDASTRLADGFTRAFARIALEAEDLAAVGEKVVNVFADRGTDALVEFAKTGRFVFKEFANAILEDLIRIIARLLIVQSLSAITGGSSGLLGGALNAGAQFGKTVQPGQAPLPVGEGGPELFVPNRTGTIVPNARDVKQAAPVVKVNVNVVASPTDIVREAVKSGEVTEDIIVELAANPEKTKTVLG